MKQRFKKQEVDRSDDGRIKWRNQQKHYKLLVLLSVVCVCCLELIYKSLGVFFFLICRSEVVKPFLLSLKDG